MAKKKTRKTDEQSKVKVFTASHLMLYIILSIYIVVSLMCVLFIGMSIISDKYEGIAQTFIIPTVSLVGSCSCTAVGFYTSKASKENEIKLSNDKYRMRLEIAKEIFAEYGTSLDEKSVDLLRKLMSDDSVSEIAPNTINFPPDFVTDLGNVSTINDINKGLG